MKTFRSYKLIFLKPRVLAFILVGVGFMFLTFFTHQDALELGISGIASIFIGIGVNNFTAIETEQKEELKLNRKTRQAIKTLMDVQKKTAKIKQLAAVCPEMLNPELEEMNDYIELCIEYLKDA